MKIMDKRLNIGRESITSRKEKVLYLALLAGLIIMYATYIPCLLDYYIVRPEQSYLSFFSENFQESSYTFEGIVIGMAAAALYCLTLRTGVSTLIVSVCLFILTHASYIKYINRKELLKLDDLRLTEAAGMALDYFCFTLNRWLVLLAGLLLLFVGAGFALDWLRKKALKDCEDGGKVQKEKKNGGELCRQKEGVDCNSGFPFCKRVSPSASGIQKEGDMDRGAAAESHPHRHRGIVVCARLLGCVCLCVVIALYTDHYLGERYVIDVIGPLVPETDRYVLYRFLQNDSLSTINVEHAEESYDFLLSKEPAKEVVDRENYPNVIVIMNESWWNTDNIRTDRISFSKDPMEPYKALTDRCTTGYVTTAVFGGGTVTPEIEFLTGLNAKYYRVDSAYKQMEGRRIPSLVDYFNGLEYETVSIHPYYGWYYGRDAAYEAMGFDRKVFEEDMQYRDIYTRYISDESLVKQIIAEMEMASDNPKFIWALSIANHRSGLNYPIEQAEDFDFPITLIDKDMELGEKEQDVLLDYINGIYLANNAFSQLVEYFSETEQPTVLLMFGDHSPFFSTNLLEAFGLRDEAGNRENVERLYSTPVIMWSNLSEEKLSFSGESIYYLPQMLIDYAELPDCNMTRILRYERSYFKTNSPKFVRDTAGEELYECTEEQLRVLNHCKVVQYDILHGEGIGRDVWQPVRTGE